MLENGKYAAWFKMDKPDFLTIMDRRVRGGPALSISSRVTI